MYPQAQFDAVCQWARASGLCSHLDGARLFNAVVASGMSAARLCRDVDSVSICFSKGLGCPMGSILVGPAETIAKARRARKLFGGALRQAGIVAAAALHAIDHHIERLDIDHRHARLLASEIRAVPGITIDPPDIDTNLVFFEVDRAWGTAADLSAALREQGVWINPAGPQRLRACTHLDVAESQVLRAAKAIWEVLAKERQEVGAASIKPTAASDGVYSRT